MINTGLGNVFSRSKIKQKQKQNKKQKQKPEHSSVVRVILEWLE